MDSSRRAVESYWRSRTIDSATANEDKVTPVYKLEEICKLLRSSHVSIVKEISEFILKRLEHKSPIVKQKALRLIKYAVGKSGLEFKREMQRHSVAVRQLFHYKGEPDPLKGDGLNKAVRDTAHEAIAAIFSEEENKPSPPEANNNRQMQGFGNTNFQAPSEDKKSFLSEVVEIGSASIKLGLSSLTQGHSLMKNETGSYRSPSLRRSLSTETEHGDTYQPVKYHNESQSTFGSNNQSSGPWTQDSKVIKMEVSNGDSNSSHLESKTRETRLLEMIVTSGGVRLQPTRDAIQVFLKEAAKLDPLALSHALELKLQSPMWQVRMKAVCVLESILRKKDNDHLSLVTSYFTENKDVVVRCSESPQASLREKANKVLGLLGVDKPNSSATNSENPLKVETANVTELPDLIDTRDSNDCYGKDNATKSHNDNNVANFTSPSPLVDDLFVDFGGSVQDSEPKNEDPFADVSFHTNESKEHADDLFSGMVLGDKQVDNVIGNRSNPETFDIFSSNSDQGSHNEFVSGLMADLSIEENTSRTKQQLNSATNLNNNVSLHHPDNILGGILGSQATVYNVNPMLPTGHMPYGIQHGVMTNHMNQLYSTQPLNYGAMGNLLAQQQFLTTMANFQHINNVNMHDANVSEIGGAKGPTPLPDIFQSNFASQAPSSVINNPKKEETKAFDFISDHIASARDQKSDLKLQTPVLVADDISGTVLDLTK